MRKKEHPQWALQYKRQGCELRLIRGRYYLYEYKTVYNPERKGPRKITGKLLGSITEKDGFIPSGKRELERAARQQAALGKPICREYGISQLVVSRFEGILKKLQVHFPFHWADILAMAYCRLLHQCPIKSVAFRLEQSYLGELIPHSKLVPKAASDLLKTLGGMRSEQLAYMRSFLSKGEYLLIDATDITSHSQHMFLTRSGYNSRMSFDGQFNLLYLYSSQTHQPIYFRLLPGNIREVRAFKSALQDIGLTKAVVIADKGFYSQKNIDMLRSERLHFIMPLRRNHSLIDYSLIRKNTFKQDDMFFEHQGRIIWYQEYTYDRMLLVTYLDESLRLMEEKDYLRRIHTHPESHSIEEYHQIKDTFGTITLITNLKRKDAQEIYHTYKSRGAIETMFDSMKNVLEADHTYMQNEQTLHGWMFINHIALQWYQSLYLELKDKDLISKYSVKDYINHLSDARMIRINDQWHLAELSSNTRKLLAKLQISIDEDNT